MNTIVVMPVAQSAMRTHEFNAVTIGGREMVITVDAMSDMADAAVLEDVQKSLANGVKVSRREESGGSGTFYFLLIVGWIVLLVVLFLGYMLAVSADFVPYLSRWPDWLPLVGGTSSTAGILRVWLMCGLVMALFVVFRMFKRAR